MKKALPYSLFAIIFHGACIALLSYSPVNKPPTKPVPFKEKIVALREPLPSVATVTTPQPTLKEHTDKRDIEPSPQKPSVKPPVEKKKLRIFKNLVSPINLKKSRNHNPREKITPQQTKA